MTGSSQQIFAPRWKIRRSSSAGKKAPGICERIDALLLLENFCVVGERLGQRGGWRALRLLLERDRVIDGLGQGICFGTLLSIQEVNIDQEYCIETRTVLPHLVRCSI